MWPATLLALGAAATAAAAAAAAPPRTASSARSGSSVAAAASPPPPASALGPSPTGLYDCAVQQELGCFRGGFAFNNASSLFERTMNRDRSANAATGNSPRRCAEFCATHFFALSAVSVDLVLKQDRCTCGNSSAAAGARVAGGKCASKPAPGEYNLTTRQYTAPACLSGAASCACSGNTSAACVSAAVSFRARAASRLLPNHRHPKPDKLLLRRATRASRACSGTRARRAPGRIDTSAR